MLLGAAKKEKKKKSFGLIEGNKRGEQFTLEEGSKSKKIYVSQKRKAIREGKKSKKRKGSARIPHPVNTQGKASSWSASTIAFLLPYSSPAGMEAPFYRCKNKGSGLFSSVQLLSCVQLCNPMNCSMPGLPVHHQLPEFTQTHVHRVGDMIEPSHPLSSPSPAPNPSQHQGLFQ